MKSKLLRMGLILALLVSLLALGAVTTGFFVAGEDSDCPGGIEVCLFGEDGDCPG